MIKEYEQLRSDKAYSVVDKNIYEISGPDFEDVLDLILPKNIEFLDILTCGYTFLLNRDGSIFAEVTFYKFEDKYILVSNRELASYFEQITSDFEFEEISDSVHIIQIEGKNSGELAQKFYEYDISTLGFKGMTEFTYNETKAWMARFGFSGEFGYQFLLPPSEIKNFIEEELSQVVDYNSQLDVYTKFEVGQPIEPIFSLTEYSIFELGYSWNLDFTKTEFVGREELLEKISNTNVRSVVFTSTEKLSVNEEIFFENDQVGMVCWMTDMQDSAGKYLGMMIVDKNYAHSGVHFVTGSGKEILTLSNPYRIPESWGK